MKPIYLTEAEKEHLSKFLSKRAIAGAYFFVGMALFLFVTVTIALSQRSPDLPRFTAEDYVPISMILLGLVLAGGWLYSRKRAVRRWFDEPMYEVNGRILSITQLPYSGKRVSFRIQPQYGEPLVANMSYIGTPDWQVGDDIGLIVWKNGRFCPRNFDYLVDVAYLPTPERRTKTRRRIIIGILIYLLISACGILLGLYGQGRL